MPYIPAIHIDIEDNLETEDTTMSAVSVITPYRVSTITCNGDIIKNIKREIVTSSRPRGRRSAASTSQESSNASVTPVVVETSLSSSSENKSVAGTASAAGPKKKDEFIHLQVFFENVALVNPHSNDVGFIWVENGPNRSRGNNLKKAKRSAEERKIFDNQVTVIYRFSEKYMPNIKLFRNGNIHITGIRHPSDGEFIVKKMSEEVLRIAKDEKNILNQALVTDLSVIEPCNFKIRMINSDFSIPFRIRRKDLHRLLISHVYNNICSFQPGTYPGVKLQYYWNEHYHQHDGRCMCDEHCDGKGDGSRIGFCKKVTISVFESGKVLITGATSFEQIEKAYAFICKVIMDNQDELKKVVPVPVSGV